MKVKEREIYQVLTGEIGASLCTACKYGQWSGGGCCDSYNECQHPIEELSWENKHQDMLEPGGDCYGFKPDMTVLLLSNLVGVILAEGCVDWMFKRYSRESITVYYQGYGARREESGSVRIN